MSARLFRECHAFPARSFQPCAPPRCDRGNTRRISRCFLWQDKALDGLAAKSAEIDFSPGMFGKPRKCSEACLPKHDKHGGAGNRFLLLRLGGLSVSSQKQCV